MPLPAPVTQTILFSKGCTHPLPRQSIDNPTASAPGRREPFSTASEVLSFFSPTRVD
jgi:hypothetical protein